VIHRIVLVLAAGAGLGAAPPPVTASDSDPSHSEMRATIERYTADQASLTRVYPIGMSANRRDRMTRFYTEWLDRLAKMDFGSMGRDGRVDYLLFRNHLQHQTRQLDLNATAEAAAAPLTPFAQTIVSLEEARRRMEPIDSAKAAAVLDALGKQVDGIRKSVEAELRTAAPKKTIGARAARAVTELRGTLRRWFDFYNGYDPLFGLTSGWRFYKGE
jgi:hypothetical protein